MNKKVVGLALLLGLTVALGACNNASDTSPSPAATTTPASPATTTTPVAPKATTSPKPTTSP